MINAADIEQLNKVLDSMIQYELVLRDFYNRCAELWAGDQTFWHNLAKAEVNHAEYIKKMKEIITNKQELFQAGRPFNPVTLNTAMAWIKDNASHLTASGSSYDKMLIMARDIENSILESRYAEIVKTADIEYQTLLKNIMAQTQEHRKIIQEKIEKTKTKGQ